jgi:hypothetical protein
MNTQQVLKDYTSIVIARQSALKATQSLVDSHNLKLSMAQFMRLCDRFYSWIESGDRRWIDKVDEFFKLEENKNFEEVFKDNEI